MQFHNDAEAERVAERFHKGFGYANVALAVLHLGAFAASVAAAYWHFNGSKEHKQAAESLEARDIRVMQAGGEA